MHDLMAPARSTSQRMDALEEANRIRSKRARLKRDLKAGRLSLLDLMVEEDCASMKVLDALLSMPKVGRVKAEKALRQARISPSKTLGGMTDRQRGELLPLLPEPRRAPAMMARC